MASASIASGTPEPGTICWLLAIPPEIREMVVSYVKKPSDLANLCSVHSVLRCSALPPLYATLSLSIDMLTTNPASMLNAKNTGLQHVRCLELKERRKRYHQTIHGTIVMNLLNVLPRDKLTLVYIDTASEVSSAIDNRILKTQTKLQQLTVHAGGQLQRMPLIFSQKHLSTLTALSLFIKTKKDVKAHTGAIQALSNLNDLRITVMTYFLPTDRQKWPVNSLYIIQALFYQNQPLLSPPSKLKLKRLYLDGFDLFDSGASLVACLDLDRLQELALVHSAGT